MPNHGLMSKSGKPNSIIVGISGAKGAASLAELARARIFPASSGSFPKLGRASPGQVPLDFTDRKLDQILVDLGAQRVAQGLRISLADDAERARWRHHDQSLGFAASDSHVEPAGQPHEETALRLVVPIGLLHCATRLAHRIDRPTGRVRSLLAGLRIGLL